MQARSKTCPHGTGIAAPSIGSLHMIQMGLTPVSYTVYPRSSQIDSRFLRGSIDLFDRLSWHVYFKCWKLLELPKED